ncbi:hypothetical protein C8Q72DRAFT_190678 [Fomitopsis betulina]|nr:hypothetical protein C8Q72DRAFT_190678 [Fomitopsis betulina]
MSNFGIDAAQLVALFMESVAWGMQCITVTLCVCTLVSKSRDSQRPVNLHLLAYALVLFGLGTLDIGLAVYRNLQAFVYSSGAGAVFGQISDYVTVLRSGCDFLAVLVADSALIYRCYVLYNRRWIVALPSAILWLAGFACAIAETYYSATATQSTNLAGAAKIEPFLNAFIVSCVSLNVITTALILYRINSIHRASAGCFSEASGTLVSNRMKWSELSRILIESAFLYTLSGVILLIVNFAGSNAVYPVSDINLQIAGIQFDLILIRVGRGIAAEHVEARTSVQTMQFNLRALDTTPGQTRRPVMHISVTQDTSVSTELRTPYSDIENKKGGQGDLMGIQSIRIAGMDEDLHYI